MNSPAKIARGSAVVASVVWGVVLFFTGLDLDSNVRRALSYLPSVLGLSVVAFDLWLWKIPGISKVTGRPHLHGTWRTTLAPSASSHIPEGGNRSPRGAAVIEQTFWTISVRLHTDQSSSTSVTAALVNNQDSKHSKRLCFTYANKARQAHNERSYAHHGTTLLGVVGTSPDALEGAYWTDRLTTGDILMELVDRKTDVSGIGALRAAWEPEFR